jgi:hypothetical protein
MLARGGQQIGQLGQLGANNAHLLFKGLSMKGSKDLARFMYKITQPGPWW